MRSRKKNKAEQPLGTAYIESLDQEGRGVAHVDGKAIFIQGALPNETVRYQSTRVKAGACPRWRGAGPGRHGLPWSFGRRAAG